MCCSEYFFFSYFKTACGSDSHVSSTFKLLRDNKNASKLDETNYVESKDIL